VRSLSLRANACRRSLVKLPSLLFAGLAGLVAAPLGAQTLSLAEALRAGEAQAPRLAAQRHAVSSAGYQVARASELPDPKLKVGLENLPVTGDSRFRYDRDFMTQRTIGLVQDFPSTAKRLARSARAGRQHDVEQAALVAQRAVAHREIASAWLDLHFALQARAALVRLVEQFRFQSDASASGVASGRQSAADAYAQRTALEQANDRVIEQERVVAKARIALSAWVGEQASLPLAPPPDTTKFIHPEEHLIMRLGEHPVLRVLDERESLARAEAELARSTRERDWSLEVGYSQRRPAFDNMISVMVAIDLPIATARRQDRDVASKLAEVEQARAMREDALRMHEAEVRSLLADWTTANHRAGRFDAVLLPLARDRAAAALAAYRGGRAELGAVLEAERGLTEAELARVQALTERGRAWAGLNYLYADGSQP
jgi:outer membrane protein TolC